MALSRKAHSSHTPCPTPYGSTYCGPFCDHTVDTEAQVSVSAQLNSQALSVAFCAFDKPWSIFGRLQTVHWWSLWVKKTLFLCTGPKKLKGKYFNLRGFRPCKKSAMDPNGPLQKCTGVSKGTESSPKHPGGKREVYPASKVIKMIILF